LFSDKFLGRSEGCMVPELGSDLLANESGRGPLHVYVYTELDKVCACSR